VDTKRPKNATKKPKKCDDCLAPDEYLTQCLSCSSASWFCEQCFLPCAVCKDKRSCPECLAHCSYCELEFCGSDKCRKTLNCGYCESDICQECAEGKYCLKCKRLCCEECAPAFTEGCDICGMSEHFVVTAVLQTATKGTKGMTTRKTPKKSPS
jgi:hypothetical protein